MQKQLQKWSGVQYPLKHHQNRFKNITVDLYLNPSTGDPGRVGGPGRPGDRGRIGIGEPGEQGDRGFPGPDGSTGK